MTKRLTPWIAACLDGGKTVILVRVTQARGSAPRAPGTAMAVTAEDFRGTIGGGRLEWEAIARARDMIAEDLASDRLDLPLGPAVGQCCGGHVLLSLERADKAALAQLKQEEEAQAAGEPQVAVFGAGHVGRALVATLAALPLRLTWWDGRTELFPKETTAAVESGDPLDVMQGAESGSAVLVMTHDHGLDFQITEAALRRGDLAYVGLIGSRTKARRFERWFVARGGDPRRLDDLVCPIGEGANRDKRPAVIAVLAAAEVLGALAEDQRERQGGAAARLGGKAKP